jgi:hypothetical protein
MLPSAYCRRLRVWLRICETFSGLPTRARIEILRLKRLVFDFATLWERERVGAVSRCLPAPCQWQARLGLSRAGQIGMDGSEDRHLAPSHCPMWVEQHWVETVP